MDSDTLIQYARAASAILYLFLAFYLGKRAYLNHLGSHARRWLMSLLSAYFALDFIREGWATVAWVFRTNGQPLGSLNDGFWYPLLAVVTVGVILALIFVWRRTDNKEGA